MRGEGSGCGVSANESTCAHHVTWMPKKLGIQLHNLPLFPDCYHPLIPLFQVCLLRSLLSLHLHCFLYILLAFKAFSLPLPLLFPVKTEMPPLKGQII